MPRGQAARAAAVMERVTGAISSAEFTRDRVQPNSSAEDAGLHMSYG